MLHQRSPLFIQCAGWMGVLGLCGASGCFNPSGKADDATSQESGQESGPDSSGTGVASPTGSGTAPTSEPSGSTTLPSETSGSSSGGPITSGTSTGDDTTMLTTLETVTTIDTLTTDATGAGCMCGDGIPCPAEEECDGGIAGDQFCTEACKRRFFHVFVSEHTSAGVLGMDGLASADEICDGEGKQLGSKVGEFKAWLSDSVTSPEQRFVKSDRPYVLPDKTQVAANYTALIQSGPEVMIAMHANGMPAPAVTEPCTEGTTVWTGTDNGGNAQVKKNCGDWKSVAMTGAVGTYKGEPGAWTLCNLDGKCNLIARLYCFEQPPKG